ncbi:cell wall metabolism sensor histidine kinase WalK [Pararhodobacter sp. CCB-MM2]|uniref:sensor histidine kinase n=1 Tax=Pararhodobacter sp. CCB-MM2 TaxID=1786003 RepID=UPI00082DA32B|nr:ATP-binding protein [Pararhodobacter sp. CCB-MM2]MCA2010969.1 two-component sensor histidine kinase [Cereibacter sphaeroides]
MTQDLAACGALIDALPDPALLVGADRRILLANPAARDLFAAPMVGASALSYIRQPEPAAALEKGLAMLADPSAPQDPVEARMIQTAPTRETILRVHVAALSPESQLPAILVTLRDISHVEEAEQQRRDFVANVSHEMRSPLTVLAGFIETLKGPARNDPAATLNFLDIMDREAQRMSRLVSDLLSLSRVESEERVRPRATVSMSDVLRATLAALRPQFEDAGIVVDFRDLPDAPMIAGDRDQLVQVFHNLVENALKYGGSGGKVALSLEKLEQMPGFTGPVLRVCVRDFGDGIDAIHLPRLTERFYRVDGHRSRNMGGTGLGLAIVKHIINRHRGRLSIRSTRGEGSTFAVVLPIS